MILPWLAWTVAEEGTEGVSNRAALGLDYAEGTVEAAERTRDGLTNRASTVGHQLSAPRRQLDKVTEAAKTAGKLIGGGALAAVGAAIVRTALNR